MNWGYHRSSPTISVVHLPTGIVAASCNDRSQHRNKAKALSLLRAKLYAKSIGLRSAPPPDSIVEPAGSYLDSVVNYGLYGKVEEVSTEQVIEDIKAAINRLARDSGLKPPYEIVEKPVDK